MPKVRGIEVTLNPTSVIVVLGTLVLSFEPTLETLVGSHQRISPELASSLLLRLKMVQEPAPA